MEAERLRKIDLFASLDDGELEELAEIADETSVIEGETLARKGTWSYQLFAIEDGEVDIRRDDETVATLGPGDVKVIYFTQSQVKRMRKSLPDLDDKLEKILAEREV